MELVRWTRFKERRGRAVGIAMVRLPAGLEINGVLVIEKGGEIWANLPSAVRVRGGEMLREPDGRPSYQQILRWTSGDLARAWSARVIELVRERYPGDL